MDYMVTEITKMFPMVGIYLAAGIFVFFLIMGFIVAAPVFSRKEIPGVVKLSLALLLTISITPLAKPDIHVIQSSFALSILLNFTVGAMIGFVAKDILLAVDAGADMINLQMGLTSATVLDPSTSRQVSLIGNIFSVLGILIFIELGGIYWMFNAFIRSITIFPLGAVTLPLDKLVNLDY